jgi:transketolase
VTGGLGGAVAEALAETCPVPMERGGVNDTFGRSGKVPELLEHFGLTAANIAAKARAAIARKK